MLCNLLIIELLMGVLAFLPFICYEQLLSLDVMILNDREKEINKLQLIRLYYYMRSFHFSSSQSSNQKLFVSDFMIDYIDLNFYLLKKFQIIKMPKIQISLTFN